MRLVIMMFRMKSKYSHVKPKTHLRCELNKYYQSRSVSLEVNRGDQSFKTFHFPLVFRKCSEPAQHVSQKQKNSRSSNNIDETSNKTIKTQKQKKHTQQQQKYTKQKKINETNKKQTNKHKSKRAEQNSSSRRHQQQQ